MREVWKFEVPIRYGVHVLEGVPVGSVLFDLDLQDGQLVTWALVDPEAPIGPVTVELTGTGHALESEGEVRHIGRKMVDLVTSYQVYHLFEVLTEGYLEAHDRRVREGC